MTMSLAGSSIAILVANGFEENQITEVQRSLTKNKIPYKVIAPEQGLVNGWQNNAWGHCFTVDEQISSALGSDYDALILIGGMRSAEKLKTNPHARRIINHFLEAKKPVAAFGDAVLLLALSPKSTGLAVACGQNHHAEIEAAGMTSVDEHLSLERSVLTSNAQEIGEDVETFIGLLANESSGEREAA